MTADYVSKELNAIANPEKAKLLQRYFKTGPGEYAEGDKFLGIVVPLQKNIAKKYHELDLNEIQKLLSSNIHEYRFTALKILVLKYEKASQKDKKEIIKFYLKNKKYINNWDLVDTSAPYILSNWLLDKDRSVLYKLAVSKNVWDRRIAIISTAFFIKNGDFVDTFKLAKMFLSDRHDLIHKATGWMLREVGKKSESALEKFLNENCSAMPRTMLRYSIEKMPKSKQRIYLYAKISS